MRHRLISVTSAALLMVGVLAAGCGSGTNTQGSVTVTSTPATTATSLPTPATTATSLPATTTTVTQATTTIAPTTTTTLQTTSTTRASSTTSTAGVDSGITGMVTLGPISPVEQQGVPNDKPYSATIVIEDATANVVTRVQSGADGRFTVKLPPARTRSSR